jgi:hypothetical protein
LQQTNCPGLSPVASCEIVSLAGDWRSPAEITGLNPGAAHVDALHHLLGYLASTRRRVLRLAPDAQEVTVYSDASWATQNSTSGGVILYKGCPVQWWSRRQKSVAASTAEAECFAAALATRECVYVRDLLDDLGFGVTAPTPLFLDSKSALDLAADPVAFKKTKHILRHAYELRDRVARMLYEPRYVPTADQLGDIFTKALRPALHVSLLDRLLTVSSDVADSLADSASA